MPCIQRDSLRGLIVIVGAVKNVSVSATERDIACEEATDRIESLLEEYRRHRAVETGRRLVVRLAEWAGWLYFVDSELLDSYLAHRRS